MCLSSLRSALLALTIVAGMAPAVIANPVGASAAESVPIDDILIDPPEEKTDSISLSQRLAVGGRHTCAIDDIGAVWCWGSNDLGQLGPRLVDDTDTGGPTPRQVELGGLRAVAIDAAADRSCAVGSDGTIRCWGQTLPSADGEPTAWATPTDVDGVVAIDLQAGSAEAIDVAVSFASSCALFDDGTARCWGSNRHHGLGVPSSELANGISTVDFGPNRHATALGSGTGHTCAVLDDGAVACWGQNAVGQLGRPDPYDHAPAEVRLPQGHRAVQVSVGDQHTCALSDEGAVWCFGDNHQLQLGTAQTPTSAGTAVQVEVDFGSNPVPFTAIAAGAYHTCAITDTAAVACWGGSRWGEAGIAPTQGPNGQKLVATAPTTHQYLSATDPADADAVAIAAGSGHVCVATISSVIRCWGTNHSGQLGTHQIRILYSARPTFVTGVDFHVFRDGDGDTIADLDDNCPTVANDEQGDYDGDGLGDACEPVDPRAASTQRWWIAYAPTVWPGMFAPGTPCWDALESYPFGTDAAFPPHEC